MKVLLLLLILLIFAAPGHALACADPDEPPFSQNLAGAENVFIFRVLSLHLADRAPNSKSTIGEIEILRQMKGRPTVERVSYEAVRCGGLRLHVGRYYVAATRESGPVLHLVRGDNSLLDVTSDYANVYPALPEEAKWQWQVESYLRGKPLSPAFLHAELYLTAHGTLPPPPPPPAAPQAP